MSDKPFLDTNVLLYAYTENDAKKHTTALSLLDTLNHGEIIISPQVLNEFYVNMVKKFKKTHTEIILCVDDIIGFTHVAPLTIETIQCCIGIRERYGFHWYDSMILSSALENGCTVVYSEDMQNGQRIEGSLLIKNPFQKDTYAGKTNHPLP
jgi:predicted nucleic acid-binding protein